MKKLVKVNYWCENCGQSIKNCKCHPKYTKWKPIKIYEEKGGNNEKN